MTKGLFRTKLGLLANLFIIGVLICSALPAVSVGAQGDTTYTKEDLDALYGNWPQWDTYDPFTLACTDQGSRDSALKGNDNIEKAFTYFIGKQLSAPQAAGILGNLMQESHVNPTLHQFDRDGNPMATGPLPVNEVGFGIAQWTFTSRQQPLVNLANSRNVQPNTLAVQLDYMWQELNGTHKKALEELKKETTAAGAARSFHDFYEGSSDDARAIQERVDDAESVLAKFGASVQNAPPGSFETTGCGGSGILVGEYSFPLAPQKKQNYGYTLPCTKPKLTGPNDEKNGNKPWTVNGVYTDKYGQKTTISTCHHDATPAFDLSYGTEETGRQPIYAVTTGRITRVNYKAAHKGKGYWGRACHSINFKADTETDKSYYWYGHVISTRPASNDVDDIVPAGTVIGYVAPEEYGPVCWQGGVHLHIDRGCIEGGTPGDLLSGTPRQGGGDGCRDPSFLNDLIKIWEALPTE